MLFLNKLKEEKKLQNELVMQERKELEAKAAEMQKKLQGSGEKEGMDKNSEQDVEKQLKRSMPNE